jgi:acetoin utilization deacetylase AcuC-like enzyme
MAQTGFYWDEKCFWHAGGNYAMTLPLGGFVQPMAAGGLPEDPETKRRLKNLLNVSGLFEELDVKSAPAATRDDLLRVHPETYLDAFKTISDAGGGELGLRTPFAQGGYEIAALSAGLVTQAIADVLQGKTKNAYALARPPGHHCLPDFPNGFCLMANIAIGIESAFHSKLAKRIAVVDWDVHHGNGTEAIFYDRSDVLTISVHQENNYPLDTGDFADQGRGEGLGANLNLPLPPGAGHETYLDVMDRIIIPKLADFNPDIVVVACGFDAALIDPLSRMTATAETFSEMTKRLMSFCEETCEGRLVLAHEGGYSEVYVPFCGHAVLETLSGSDIHVPDPFAATFTIRQPKGAFADFLTTVVDDLAKKSGF